VARIAAARAAGIAREAAYRTVDFIENPIVHSATCEQEAADYQAMTCTHGSLREGDAQTEVPGYHKLRKGATFIARAATNFESLGEPRSAT
jgi:hypothetical protein